MIKKISGIILFCFIGIQGQSMMNKDDSMAGEMFVHPIFAHMGLPDRPGELSLRTLLEQTNNKGNLTTDFGLHFETGLVNRVGLHIRNAALRKEDYSEIMLQYTPLVDKKYMNGLSVFGELEIPTGAHKSTHYNGTVGISGAFTISTITNFNGAVEYDFDEKTAEYEGSFVFRASKILFPIIEYNGDISNDVQSMYIIPGIKFRINAASAIGTGAQIAVTHDREFDIRALATFDYMI